MACQIRLGRARRRSRDSFTEAWNSATFVSRASRESHGEKRESSRACVFAWTAKAFASREAPALASWRTGVQGWRARDSASSPALRAGTWKLGMIGEFALVLPP